MRKSFRSLMVIPALAGVLAGSVIIPATASARGYEMRHGGPGWGGPPPGARWHRGPGWGPGAVVGGIIGGVALGALGGMAVASAVPPPVAYGPPPPVYAVPGGPYPMATPYAYPSYPVYPGYAPYRSW
ncbi:hypothetical protein [Acetobacter oeni]|uniref:Uncharacterized protein n=1 Tax=Acetobacter oeni TaxID=304077 RepID=A0A511XK34_9PROT|nr:hypothetical protein [Acetobacter oeni]MBB3883125.1 hypothetical protein [Acetobacter oeni]NHO19235.1 hypothetical protein [Acetobacter oeni]GEN63306.1 hypothetical protein AOE01nite_15300 [Acetobacter oeni]